MNPLWVVGFWCDSNCKLITYKFVCRSFKGTLVIWCCGQLRLMCKSSFCFTSKMTWFEFHISFTFSWTFQPYFAMHFSNHGVNWFPFRFPHACESLLSLSYSTFHCQSAWLWFFLVSRLLPKINKFYDYESNSLSVPAIHCWMRCEIQITLRSWEFLFCSLHSYLRIFAS